MSERFARIDDRQIEFDPPNREGARRGRLFSASQIPFQTWFATVSTNRCQMLMQIMEELVRTLRSMTQLCAEPLWIRYPDRAFRQAKCDHTIRQPARKESMSWTRYPSQANGERRISPSATSRSMQTTILKGDYVTQDEDQAQQCNVLRFSLTSAGGMSRDPEFPRQRQFAIPRKVV